MSSEGTPVQPRRCFVIAPIGDDESETRHRSDQVMRYVITPVVEQLGYEARRGDQLDRVGFITAQVLDHIVNDELVIADLTDQNANVFYELAVRHAIRKPFVQLVKAGQPLPFDVQGMRTIEVDLGDPDRIEAAKHKLLDSITWLEKHADEIITPISSAIVAEDLRGPSRPENAVLTQVAQLLPQVIEAMQAMQPQQTPQDPDTPEFRQTRKLVETLVIKDKITHDELRTLWNGGASTVQFDRWVQGLMSRFEHPDPR